MSKELCDCENPVHDCHFADNCRVTSRFQKAKIRSSELKPIEEITKPYRETIEAQAKEIEELNKRLDRNIKTMLSMQTERNKYAITRAANNKEIKELRAALVVAINAMELDGSAFLHHELRYTEALTRCKEVLT